MNALRSVAATPVVPSPPASPVGLSACAIAAAIARGELRALEVVEAHIARIEQENPRLNAVVVKRYDSARAEARAVDERRARGEPLGPLAGVPITIKECLDLAGTPSTFGLPLRKDLLAERDDVWVARLRDAGAIVLGKTNVAQMLFFIEADNPLYGLTRHPLDPERTPGGSSGGEGAILAVGGSALGLGTDIGGSIRVPAAFCGLAGFRPTAGRTPDAGRHSAPFGQRAIVSQVGPLARTVDDLTLALRCLSAGPAPDDGPTVALGDPATVDLTRLRVACFTEDGTFRPSPAVRRSVAEAAGFLRAAGATVTEWSPPDVQTALDLEYGLFAADGGRALLDTIGKNPRDPRIAQILFSGTRSRPTLWLLERVARWLGQASVGDILRNFGHRDTAHYWTLVETQIDYQRRFREALDRAPGGPFDLILSPACGLPALRHGASKELNLIGGYTVLYNVLGYPAGVVPVSRVRAGEESDRPASRDLAERAARRCEEGSAGLPVGVQVAARPWQDHLALAALRAIEQAATGR